MTYTVNDVQKLYVAFFNRPADKVGEQIQLDALNSGTTSLEAIAAAFAQTPEYKAAFAGKTSLQIVSTLYSNLFAREATLDEAMFWAKLLENKTFTVDNIAVTLMTSAQGTDGDAVANKVAAAVEFTKDLDTLAKAEGYTGDAANAVARAWLATVNKDASSLTAAISNVAATITAATDASQNAAGQTFTLTAGVETVNGTAGNDVINALSVKADGTAADTINAFDSIDGGAGKDTLNIYTTNSENESISANTTIKNVEVIHVYNTAGAAAVGDASKFVGATELWQHGAAVDVTNLSSTTTAGFSALSATVAVDLDVSAAATATSVAIALDGVKGAAATAGAETENRADIDVDGAALAAVTVSGTLAKANTTAAKEVFTATFSGTTDNDTVTFDGTGAIALGAGKTNIQAAAAYATAYNLIAGATWVAVANGDGTVTFTSKTTGARADIASAAFVVTSGGAAADATVTAAAPTTQGASSAAASLALNVALGKDVQAGTVNTAVTTILTIDNDAASTKDLLSVDASASSGAITYTSADNKVQTIKGGSGNDTLAIITATLKDDTTTTTVDETISATVDSGAGDDAITVNTNGTGTTTVKAGAGDDTVTLTGHSSGKLTVDLGDGNDTFKGAGAVAGTDSIDGGAGTDTLLLNMVGSANIGAFSNFETFDAVSLGKTLDVEILATKNTVTEFVASGDVGTNAILSNVGAGVNFRATGDMTTNALTLNQKTAGALTVTLDADSTSTTAQNDTNLKVTASNATSLKAVFAVDSGYVQNGANLNDQTITLTGTKATSLEVVSGGTNATNVLNYTGGDDSAAGKGDLLTSVTISGDKAITFAYTAVDATEISSVNASALTGALTIGLNTVKAGGTLTLGGGDDIVTVHTGLGASVSAAADAAAAVAAMRSISGLKAGAGEDATAQSAFDVVKLTGAVQAADVAATATHTVKDGLFTFNGAGPATLADAVQLVASVAAANEAVVFEYVGNSYIFAEGATNGGVDDVLVKLVGVTGLHGLDDINAAGTNLYVF